MNNKILGIEKSEILFDTLAKFLEIKMDLIHIPSKNRDFLSSNKSTNIFKSKKLSEQIDELNNIKNNYDLSLVSSWHAAKLSYLCNMRYIFYFIGDDIRHPPFSEKIISEHDDDLIFLKKQFYTYKDVFDNAEICITGSQELFHLLKSFRKDSVRIDRTMTDTHLFNRNLKPIKIKKNKFTFFCPTRISSQKGIDLLWEAVNLCTTDFDILQVNWIDTKNPITQKESEQILKNKPENVYLIDKINYVDMGKYYTFADCILGEMNTGHTNSIEREAVLCFKPVLTYNNIQMKSLIDGKELVTPFLPHSNNPKEIAKLIDRIVSDKKFRESLTEREYIFIKNLTDPQKTALEFENIIKRFI